MRNNIYKRIARAEAMVDLQKADMMETLKASYRRACADLDFEEAAEFARKIRNKLLDTTDREMSLDRLGLDVSSPTKFMSALSKIFSGGWVKYRQALRDLTEQEGFPFSVEWPDEPTDE